MYDKLVFWIFSLNREYSSNTCRVHFSEKKVGKWKMKNEKRKTKNEDHHHPKNKIKIWRSLTCPPVYDSFHFFLLSYFLLSFYFSQSKSFSFMYPFSTSFCFIFSFTFCLLLFLLLLSMYIFSFLSFARSVYPAYLRRRLNSFTRVNCL